MATGTIRKNHIAPAYTTKINLLNNPIPQFPTTSSGSTTYTAPQDGILTLYADRQAQGMTLYGIIDGVTVLEAPAHFGNATFAFSIPMRKGSKVGFKTDGNNSWIIRVISFLY